jgi:hypothetical protein
MPLVNILGSGAHLTTAVLDIVDCTGHMAEGGKKDAAYLAGLCFPHLEKLDPEQKLLDLILFDGASNVQKAGQIIEAKYERATVLQGAEHVVSLFFGDIAKVNEIKVRSNSRQMACNGGRQIVLTVFYPNTFGSYLFYSTELFMLGSVVVRTMAPMLFSATTVRSITGTGILD